VGLLLVLAAVMGTLRTFERSAIGPLLPALVTPQVLPRALAMATSGTQTALILGPALGGFIYMAGAGVAYGAVAVCYVVSSICMAGIALRRTPRVKKPMSLEAMLSGFKYLRSNQILLGAISLDLMAVLLGGAVALLPVFAQDVLHTDSLGLGILRAATAVGALGGSIWLAKYPLKRNAGRAMFRAVAVFGVATIVFGLSQWFIVSFLALMVAGAADVVSVVVRSTLEQLRTPDEMRGRVSSVNALFIGTSNQLGEFESGMVAAAIGAVPAVVVGGIGTLVVVALWQKWFPELRNVDKLT
jgi:predicted MFS family arabinose efflux permease